MPSANPDNRCQHHSADGRRCRMLKNDGHPYLRPHHWEQQERIARARKASPYCLSRRSRLQSADSIHQLLRDLHRLLARGASPPEGAH